MKLHSYNTCTENFLKMDTSTLRSQLHRNTDDVLFSYEWTPVVCEETQTELNRQPSSNSHSANSCRFHFLIHYPDFAGLVLLHLYTNIWPQSVRTRICMSDVTEKGAPFFMAVSWHLRSDYSVEDLPSLSLATDLLKAGHKNVVLHLCAHKLKKENVVEILRLAKENGIRNIFAIRGDRQSDPQTSDFPYAINLVKCIRKHFGDYFTIGVAGYPGGHPDSISKDADLLYLKEKVDAGADFILTQMVYDSAEFIEFVKECRSISINIPIIPGIMPIQSYQSISKMTMLCNVVLPDSIFNDIEEIKDNDKAVMEYGIQKAVQIIEDILRADINVKRIHVFTLNKSRPAITVYEEVKKNILACSS